MTHRAHRSGRRCTHGQGRAICFECFTEGSERTKARQEAWAQRALPFDETEPDARLTTTQIAHRKRMLDYLQSTARRGA